MITIKDENKAKKLVKGMRDVADPSRTFIDLDGQKYSFQEAELMAKKIEQKDDLNYDDVRMMTHIYKSLLKKLLKRWEVLTRYVVAFVQNIELEAEPKPTLSDEQLEQLKQEFKQQKENKEEDDEGEAKQEW